MKYNVNTQCHGRSSYSFMQQYNNSDGNDDPNMQKEKYSDWT